MVSKVARLSLLYARETLGAGHAELTIFDSVSGVLNAWQDCCYSE